MKIVGYNWSFTKKGPGRRHRMPLTGVDNPVGTKLVKRFIADARGENITYRQTLMRLAPKDRMLQ